LISIDNFFENISKKDLEKLVLSMSMVYELDYIKKGDYDFFIEYLKKEHVFTQYIAENKNGNLLLMKLLFIFGLKDINDEKLFEYIKENATCELVKASDWKLKKENFIGKNSKKEFLIYSADYEYCNKWGYKSGKDEYQIIANENKIIWLGRAGNKPQYFIIQKEKIYGLMYTHKKLTLTKNLENAYKEIWSDKTNDIIVRYINEPFNKTNIEIDLTAHFYKGFFYKGLLYNGNWQGEISKLKRVTFKNELLKIEIENLTYPHSGFIFLDLGTCKIIKKE
jgi:hypothetical protein